MTLLPVKIHHKQLQNGQALLVVLLTLAVVLTIVLSVSSRSVSEVSISTTEKDSTRAFSAAEAGIEKSLLNPQVGTTVVGHPNTSDTSTTFTTTANYVTPSNNQFIYPDNLNAGEVATFWLVSHASDGSLTCSGGANCYNGTGVIRLYWGDPTLDNPTVIHTCPNVPAIEVSYYYDGAATPPAVATPNDYSNVNVATSAYDPSSCSRTPANNFTGGAQTGLYGPFGGKMFLYRTQNQIPDVTCAPPGNGPVGCRLLIKVRMFYNQQPEPIAITITGGSILPAQGLLISSEGSAGQSTRQVNVFQEFPEAADIFDAAVFSMRNLVKQNL